MNAPNIPSMMKDLRNLCAYHAEHSANAVFVLDDHCTYSYDDAFKIMQHFPIMIAAHGVSEGDQVGYGFANAPLAALAVLGIMSGGYLATAINLVTGEATLEYVLEDAEVKLLLLDQAGKDVIQPILNRIHNPPIVLLIDDWQDYPAATNPTLPLIDPKTPALLMYTSGTTGKPKGVLLCHENIIAGGHNVVTAHHLNTQDRALCVLPLYHINGLCVTLIAPLLSGGSVVLPKQFSVSRFWSMLIHHQCSWFSSVPTQISYLLHAHDRVSSQEYPKLRFARSASSALPAEVQQQFEQRFGIPVIETMGITEAAAQILSNPLPPEVRKIGSPGIAVGNQVMIVDQDFQECPRGQEGEIVVKGDNVMQGYLHHPEATDEVFTPSGWLRTGDLGVMDQDGYVFVSGRLKELIIKGGENIAPREIDDVLYTHPEVIEAVAYGKDCPDYGQRVEAAVVLCADAKVTSEGLRAYCQDRLGGFKTPDVVHILDALPKGPSGKIQRRLFG